MIDVGAQYKINNADLKEAVSPIQPRVQTPSKIDHAAMHPFFAWMSVARIYKMFENTTQYMSMPSSTYFCKRYRSTNPAANIYRCQEVDATNTIFSDTPAVDGGKTSAQLFVGCTTKHSSVQSLKDTGDKSILSAF